MNKKSGKISEDNNEENWLTYGRYLHLDKILGSQQCQSENPHNGTVVHDEMLFVITHQAFELWFKQILFEMKSIAEIFRVERIEERNMLIVISRLNRIIEIIKLLNSQFSVLETMTAREFYDFRSYLQDASGFQSLQFRLLEIRLGVNEETRILPKGKHYADSFVKEDRKQLDEAHKDKSLFDLVNKWLERTPGTESDGFNFFGKFRSTVESMVEAMRVEAVECKDTARKSTLMERYESTKKLFSSVLEEDEYNKLRKRHDRRLTYKAMQGALMIFTYNEEPRFHVPYQILQTLMDLDSQFSKFRFNHACMVQKMIGSGSGTYGSSGYQYLRSTCGDRYKVFVDFAKLSSYLIPRERIPPLSRLVEKSLLIHDFETSSFDSNYVSNFSLNFLSRYRSSF